MDFIHIRQGKVNIQKSINMRQYINRLKGKRKQDHLDAEKTIRQKFDNLSRWNTQQTTNNKLYQHQHNNAIMKRAQQWGKNESFSSRTHTLHYTSTKH